MPFPEEIVFREYGKIIPPGSIGFEPGYNVLLGENNSGKSTLLQFTFISAISIGHFTEHSVYISSNRSYVGSNPVTTRSLLQWNSEFRDQYVNAPRQHESSSVPEDRELHNILVSSDLLPRIQEMQNALKKFGLGELSFPKSQQIIDSHPVNIHGSGIRSILPILAALANPEIKYIFIDEPELSLEPRIQKGLRDFFLEYVSLPENSDKILVVATHSHLMLNRQKIEYNYLLHKSSNVSFTKLHSAQDLFTATFNLLGNSLEDLYLPNNFLIVEGASDQQIALRAMELLEIRQEDIKVISANAIERTSSVAKAIEDFLRPVIAGISPYKEKIVIFVDRPRQEELLTIHGFDRFEERLYVTTFDGLEGYIPEIVYGRANLHKDEELAKISSETDYLKKAELKEELSKKLSIHISKDDIDNMVELKNALFLAKKLAN